MRRLCTIAAVIFSCAAIAPAGQSAAHQLTGALDETHLVTLSGNTRAEALDQVNDRGIVADSRPLQHMILVLKRSPAREAAFERMVSQLTDRTSPNYHRWLNAREIGDRFGPAPEDVATVTRWLGANGFSINRVYPSRVAIDFSGDAGKVRKAFHTEIHVLDVHGRSHISNMSDPRIPAALVPTIKGIASLNDFYGHSSVHGGPAYSVADCTATGELSSNCYVVTPSDVATIYDFNPLFSSQITGTGETIAVVEDSDIYSANDWTMFRSLFGLSGYTDASISQVQPGNCNDPGANGDDFEAIIDAQYSSAAAPDANIEVASCASSQTTWGLTIAVENLVNESSPPPIINASYIWCQSAMGSANNQAYYDAWQQAAAEGVSVFVSAGDEGSATCDYGNSEAYYGINVNGIASPPYEAAVGGTDFADTYLHQNATYWSATSNADYGSALSYVPEMTWNDSCGSSIIARFVTGSNNTYGANGFCNVASGQDYINTLAGGGGPSICSALWQNGCEPYPKPSWQIVLGNPTDSVRDLPDVAMFSGGQSWGHAYIFCLSDPNQDFGITCSDFPNQWDYAFGTSLSAPLMAGIQALVDQSTGAAQGNPDPTLYSLANAEFGASGERSCYAFRGNRVGKNCVFHDVTLGDTAVPCYSPSPNCFVRRGARGVLSTSTTQYNAAFRAGPGWDFATGLGSVDAANLVRAWPR